MRTYVRDDEGDIGTMDTTLTDGALIELAAATARLDAIDIERLTLKRARALLGNVSTLVAASSALVAERIQWLTDAG